MITVSNILFTYYLFGLLGTIWFRNIFAIPAIFSLFHYLIFWSGWNQDLKGVDLIHFQVTCQLCIWLGVFFGIIISIIMNFPALCKWPYKHGKRLLLKNTLILFILFSIQIVYIIIKSFFPIWYELAVLVILFIIYSLAHLWYRLEKTKKLEELFGTMKIFNLFFPVLFTIHILSLITFFIIDIIISMNMHNNDNEKKFIFWRMGILFVFTLLGSLVLIVTKLVHPSTINNNNVKIELPQRTDKNIEKGSLLQDD
ncbi:hypothetical protein LCGC14_2213110 [marine sediment metagenome]|uniref:Uncharacterized protein n=1 Tax=marine sediment metagenome TaxID=412755 RepID=A0A0F9DD39_9ZZZZ